MTEKQSIARKLLLPLSLLVLVALPFLFWEDFITWLGADLFSKTMSALRALVGILVWLLLAFVIDRLITVLIWEGVFERKGGSPVPKLLRNIVSILIYASAIAGIFGVLFGKSLTIFFAATGGAGIVIGFAVQALISDFFSGIVITLQRPFKNGDFVCLDGEWGIVHDVNWRATQILDVSNQMITFPNSKVAGMKVINTTHAGVIRQILWVTLDYAVPVERAVRILRAAARAGQREVEGREPVVEPLKIESEGIAYRIRFWVLDEEVWFDCYEEMIAAIQKHLQVAGLRYSRSLHQRPSSRVEFQPSDDREQKLELIQDAGLFGSLGTEEIDFLESRMERRHVTAGDDVVVQGEDGDSMFLIAEGLLDILVFFKDEDREVKVAQIDAGKFLGEISLLTGEPRTATVRAASDSVLFEITHPVMRDLFHRRPSLVDELTEVMTQRRLNDLMAKEKLSQEEVAEEKASIAGQILAKIKGFFKLG